MTTTTASEFTTHESLQAWASQYLPGGVTASARAHVGTGGAVYMQRGDGAHLFDIEGNEYIDMHTSYGAALLGHGHPRITATVAEAMAMGLLCAYETPRQSEAAQKLVDVLPCADMVRFTLAGTETTYYVVKLAREFTGKDKIIKFEGHFHGYNDYLQYNYWPPEGKGLPHIHPEAGGVPKELAEFVIVLPFNDLVALEQAIQQHKHDVAAVILEPINFNSGGIRPVPGYLEAMRQLTKDNGIVLIFDEILSGFRTGPGCMQEYLGVTPDLCTVGKAIGGGMPISAYAGRREIMEHVAPLGKAMHSGTYNAPLPCVMAVSAFLDEITQPDFYPPFLRRCETLYAGIRDIIGRVGVNCWLQATGARFNLLFGVDAEPRDYKEASKRNAQTANRFFDAARRHGLWFCTGWHHGISAVHTDADIARALEGIEAAMREIA